MKKQNILLIALLFAVLGFGILFGYHGYNAVIRWQDSQAASETDQIVQDIFQESIDDIVAAILENPMIGEENAGHENEPPPEPPDLSPFYEIIDAFNALREVTGNHDIMGYITIPGTSVNYIIVQGTDNRFYLNHDIFGNRNAAGSIFLDYLNSPHFTDPNTIVYGHNMRNGSKFHDLRHYVSGGQPQAFFEQHPQIIIITQYYALVYEIFSTFTTNINFFYHQVVFGHGEFQDLLNELNRRRVYDTGVVATVEDNILLLSTCINTLGRDMRIVVAGRLAQRLWIPQQQFDDDPYAEG